MAMPGGPEGERAEVKAAEAKPHTRAAEAETGTDAGSDTSVVREYRGAGIMWGGIALVVLAAAFVVVAVQNAHDVEFRFLWLTASTPLVLVIAVTIALTLLVDEVVGFWWRRRRRAHLREREELRRLRGRR